MNLNEANKIVLNHLLEILENSEDFELSNYVSKTHLINMINTCLENLEDYPADKTSRWIGYIQGIMVTQNLLNVDEERDFTRPLFHAVYKATNQKIP